MAEQILNITNGDSAVDIMRAAGVPGEYLPWRDVLHEGPVPAGLSLQALSAVRSQYIAGLKWGEYARVREGFSERDRCLESFTEFDKIVLWFEHDLYDQLQLVQILDWFFLNSNEVTYLSLICTEKYLGRLNPEQMAGMVRYEKPVVLNQLQLANRAWCAFRSDTPMAWWALLGEDTSALPFLHGAVLRQLQEYPDFYSGLSRTAFNALSALEDKEMTTAKLFGVCQMKEQRIFMGDLSFWGVLQSMMTSTPALLEASNEQILSDAVSSDQSVWITDAGRAVLSGALNFMALQPLDRWIGGVHLNAENIWCWNADQLEIVRFE